MGFLKKSSVPHELPDLALDSSNNINPKPVVEKKPVVDASKHITPLSNVTEHEEIKKQIDEHLGDDFIKKAGFFDKILEDVNGEIDDLGKLEDWYEKKFLPQNIVSNMRGYWEGNKADILIQSFGAEYKRKINEKIKALQVLEGDWREIYFKLIKKEEEMKNEERELKETLSEFVDLCKRRKHGEEKKE
jgi:hypothetical protein